MPGPSPHHIENPCCAPLLSLRHRRSCVFPNLISILLLGFREFTYNLGIKLNRQISLRLQSSPLSSRSWKLPRVADMQPRANSPDVTDSGAASATCKDQLRITGANEFDRMVKRSSKAKLRGPVLTEGRLLTLMSEVLSLREKVAQAELVAGRGRRLDPASKELPPRRTKKAV